MECASLQRTIYDFIGVDQPRKSVSGRELPNSRHIRTTLFQDLDRPAPKHSLYAMQFGQTIAHDTEFALPKRSSEFHGVPTHNVL